MTLTEYQHTLRGLLEEKLGSPAVCEWRTQMETNSYSPRLDVAVGPFSIENGVQLINECDELFEKNTVFVAKLIKYHLSNLSYINQDTPSEELKERVHQKLIEVRRFNYNSRCFVAVEIENAVSRKHLMGGAINASVLGRIGIAVGYTDEMHNAFLNLYRYFSFLQSVDKPTFSTTNLLVLSAEQLINICNEE
jgi:hypothetical protein